MNLNIKKIFSILFKKSSLFNLLIFSLLNILSTSAFFAPIAYNVIIGTIFYVITISLLIGYITETTHLFILNNFEEIELPKWNLNILKYLKHSFSLVLIFIIFELIFYFISLIPFKFLSDILQLLYIFILTFIVPCSVIIYAKNLK